MPSGKSPGTSTGAVDLDELDELVGLDEELEDELEELAEEELADDDELDDEPDELLCCSEDELADEDELSVLLDFSEELDELT